MELIGYFYKKQLPLIRDLKPQINSKDLDHYFNMEEINLYIDDEDSVESRDDVVQPVCATVILTKDHKILTVNKPNKSSLYLGGHLILDDIQEDNILTFIATIKRVATEELCYTINDSSIHHPIITYTTKTPNLANHIGIVFPIIINESFDVTNNAYQWSNLSDVSKINNLDSWSQTILDTISRPKSLIL